MSSRIVARGFTLIELLVTVALVAILLAVAVPSLTTFQRNAELTTRVNSLLAAINAARSEAMKRGMHAMVTPLGSDWQSGWRAFVDIDMDNAFSSGDVTILTSDPLPSYWKIVGTGTTSGSTPYIIYDASGYSKTTTGGFGASTIELRPTEDISGPELFAQTRRLKIASTGRARVCTPKSASDTACSDSTLLL